MIKRCRARLLALFDMKAPKTMALISFNFADESQANNMLLMNPSPQNAFFMILVLACCMSLENLALCLCSKKTMCNNLEVNIHTNSDQTASEEDSMELEGASDDPTAQPALENDRASDELDIRQQTDVLEESTSTPPGFWDQEQEERRKQALFGDDYASESLTSSTSWCKSEGSGDQALPPEIEYLERPFQELHSFYRYVLNIGEESCFDFAQQLFNGNLDDEQWDRIQRFDFDDRMVAKEWKEPGQIEIPDWAYFFAHSGIRIHYPGIDHFEINKIFECMGDLRQAAVHRDHKRISRMDLETALRLPGLFGDEDRESQLARIYDIVLQEPSNRCPENISFFETTIHTQEKTPTTLYQLMQQTQYLAECSAFKFAQKNDPEFLKEKSADCPERLELPQYTGRWEHHIWKHADSVQDYPPHIKDRRDWRDVCNLARLFRNDTTHRCLKAGPGQYSDFVFRQRIQWATNFVKAMEDPENAQRIQDLADAWSAEYAPPSDDSDVDSINLSPMPEGWEDEDLYGPEGNLGG